MVNQFKLGVRHSYGNRCVVSGIWTTQVNHIIPKFFCKNRFRYWRLIDDAYNGMLLTDTLHREFDQYVWSLNVLNADFIEESNLVEVPVVISRKHPRRGYMIDQYREARIRVRVESLPYLWVDWQVFLSVNYGGVRTQALESEYQEFLNSYGFERLREDPRQGLEEMRHFEFNPSLIIRTRDFGGQFLAFDRIKGEERWLLEEEIEEVVIEDYQSRCQLASDPNYGSRQ